MKAKRPSAPRPTVHVSIDVPSLDRGLHFYREVFGFVEKARPFPTMAIVDANNVTVCMHEKAAGTKSSSAGSATRHYDRHFGTREEEDVVNGLGHDGGLSARRIMGPDRSPRRGCRDASP